MKSFDRPNVALSAQMLLFELEKLLEKKNNKKNKKKKKKKNSSVLFHEPRLDNADDFPQCIYGGIACATWGAGRLH